MGSGMRADDFLIPGLLDVLNIRFAPPPTPRQREWLGGIEELADLQRRFQIFQSGRSFRDSAAIMNLGGFWNWRAKQRWYNVLEYYGTCESDIPGQNGDERIVGALIADLALETPWPVYFTVHEWTRPPRVMVIGDPADHASLTRPLFFINQQYLVVSVPMRSQRTVRPRRATRPTTRA
jgi:hypothetical protein